jgi:hypothetical protein
VVVRRKPGAHVFIGASLLFSVAFVGELGPAPQAWFTARARPEALGPEEERSPIAERLARRFNPAMAFSDPGVWPVDVRYAWRDGADLVASVVDREGKVVGSYVAARNAELERRSWADLPTEDDAGRFIRYGIDAPGDDRTEGGRTRWRKRWDSLVEDKTFPPTQYAHLFWLNRAEGLLGIQYWFFYPFNEWINRHEGDWEHVNVILQGPTQLSDDTGWTPVGYQFAFHSWHLDTDQVVRVAGPQPGEDHVVVFVGGRGRMLWWTGTMSGASYPLPAFYRRAGSGPIKADEDTRTPRRFIGARDFRIVMLPEPERLDATLRPELSWLRLPFYVGQEDMQSNPPLINWLGYGGPVVQPARRPAWNARKSKPPFLGSVLAVASNLRLPQDWPSLAAPWLRWSRAHTYSVPTRGSPCRRVASSGSPARSRDRDVETERQVTKAQIAQENLQHGACPNAGRYLHRDGRPVLDCSLSPAVQTRERPFPAASGANRAGSHRGNAQVEGQAPP